MLELWLIAHKVRGEPAYDVAALVACPECTSIDGPQTCNCTECDGEGYWWIIPTSGHRAYPYDAATFKLSTKEMPPNLPDHYRHGPAPKIDIKALLRTQPKQHIARKL